MTNVECSHWILYRVVKSLWWQGYPAWAESHRMTFTGKCLIFNNYFFYCKISWVWVRVFEFNVLWPPIYGLYLSMVPQPHDCIMWSWPVSCNMEGFFTRGAVNWGSFGTLASVAFLCDHFRNWARDLFTIHLKYFVLFDMIHAISINVPMTMYSIGLKDCFSFVQIDSHHQRVLYQSVGDSECKINGFLSVIRGNLLGRYFRFCRSSPIDRRHANWICVRYWSLWYFFKQ